MKILEKIKVLPLFFKGYFAVLLVLEVVLFATRPAEPGLYDYPQQYTLLGVAALGIVLSIILKKKFHKETMSFLQGLYSYSILAFLYLAIDYMTLSHAGLAQIVVTFIPVFIYWLTVFARWNFRCAKDKECRRALLLSAISWVLYAFAFPPLPLGPAALILLAPWFITLNQYSRKAILFGTFWSGMVYNTINYYWIYNVMNVGPAALILFGLVLLIAYFSVYNLLAAYVYSRVRDIKIKGKAYLLLLFPIFYAGLEMTRTRGDFSFPWSHLGYAFGNHLELIQALAFIGIFGYTIIVIASNMIVAKTFQRNGIKKMWPLALPILILGVLYIQGSITLSAPEAQPFYQTSEEESPEIALIQPSIQQGEKWSKARFDSIVTKTLGMVYDSVKPGADMIIMAETAIPEHLRRQPQVIAQLHRTADYKNAYLLTGALDFMRMKNPIGPRRYEIYNASFLFTPQDPGFPKRYVKKHLVPFSERIPFDDIFPILNYVDLGEGDFVPGKETPVYAPFHWTPFICYDAIFGDLVREAIREGSKLMVNITNDGWFGRSTAPYQHLNLVRYRAVENAYPVARNANSGVSVFIDQYGHIGKSTGLFTDEVIQQKIPLKTRHTLYEKIGDQWETILLWFFLIYLLVALFGNQAIGLVKKQTAQNP